MTADDQPLLGVPLTLSDVALIRAYARQAKIAGQDTPQEAFNAVHDELAGEVSKPLREMLAILSNPDIVEFLCNLAFDEMHTRGIRS
ncbi:hypothetical protein [Yersinia ruckeri]|uniref:hypothetical protein n=1 Tax=Yersinia ruckeri TaxID=29486 RepID=UPI002237CD46|nr:hypothetical protein [Yersinia ruckeri]MCW6598626.1 hypothetical protein [Yersinia ruckeri]